MIIGLSGVPASGKTTLARAIASMLTAKGHKVGLVDEFARSYIAETGVTESVQEQSLILERQWARENHTVRQFDVTITDSPIFLGYIYCLTLARPSNRKDAWWFNDIVLRMERYHKIRQYDVLFHLEPVAPEQQDNLRDPLYLDKGWRTKNNRILKSLLPIFPPKHLCILEDKPLVDRLKEAKEFLHNTCFLDR